MNGWQLGLALFGCFLLGVVACSGTIYWYAKRVWRQKFGQLAAQLVGASTTSSGSAPPS